MSLGKFFEKYEYFVLKWPNPQTAKEATGRIYTILEIQVQAIKVSVVQAFLVVEGAPVTVVNDVERPLHFGAFPRGSQ